MSKHLACGPLETLEVHNGRTEITGHLTPEAS
jgi:hypothetical protein